MSRCFPKVFILLILISSNVWANEITVSAASSLTNAFRDIAEQYQTENPASKVFLNFAASGVLQQQIAHGAPVDIFASADEKTMDLLVQQQFIQNDSLQLFAKNQLVVITPIDSKIRLSDLSDLQQPAIKRIAISNPDSVPVGHYSKIALQKNLLWEVLQEKTIRTQNVRHSLDYVARKEVDAGFVYRTDALLAPDQVQIALTVDMQENVHYPIAITRNGTNKIEAANFIRYVLSAAGQKILAQYGFNAP